MVIILMGGSLGRVARLADAHGNAHDEMPEDHRAANLRAAWAKANAYYAKLNNSPVYYAATILYRPYKTYCDVAWNDKPSWLESNKCAFCALWAEYNNSPRVRHRLVVLPNDMDDAIKSIVNPTATGDINKEPDEYEQWRRSEPRAGKGTVYANNPIKY
jgi:hypothetical protein